MVARVYEVAVSVAQLRALYVGDGRKDEVLVTVVCVLVDAAGREGLGGDGDGGGGLALAGTKTRTRYGLIKKPIIT